MAYLTKKKIHGKTYYYLMESKRVEGKSVHSKQIYLGSIEDVLTKLEENASIQPPLYSKDFALGSIAAFFDLAKRLGLCEMIDDTSRKRNQGIPISTYLLSAIINRAVMPVSKVHLEEWHNNTILKELMPVNDGALSSKRFWDNISRWDDDKMEAFETEFLKKIIKDYKIQPQCLIYDATNFFTYIDTENEKSTLAKRGHSKEKRNDLRIIGLSLMYSREDEIPLFYETYSGNTNDSKQFKVAADNLKKKYRDYFGGEASVTLIFDRGNNSQSNIDMLKEEDCTFDYVGGLKKNQCTALYQIPSSAYTWAESLHMSYYRTRMEVFGHIHTVVITDNPKLQDGQMQSIEKNRNRCLEEIEELQDKLEKRRNGEITRGKKPTAESLEARVKKILSAEYMKNLFCYKITEEAGKIPFLSWYYNEEELEWLKEHELGKTVLFTNQDTWKTEDIIHAYRSAWKIEHTFHQMKDANYLTVRPFYCWTDQKVKVHIFCCIMALRLSCLLKKELLEKGIDTGISNMIDCLDEKKQYTHYYKQKRGIKETYSVSVGSIESERMFEALGLKKYEKANR